MGEEGGREGGGKREGKRAGEGRDEMLVHSPGKQNSEVGDLKLKRVWWLSVS